MYKSFRIIILILFVSTIIGCTTYSLKLKPAHLVYLASDNSNKPKILLTDLEDFRADKKEVGKVNTLATYITSDPINSLITDRIAAGLRSKGFNIQGVYLKEDEKSEIGNIINNHDALGLIRGRLNKFYFKGDVLVTTSIDLYIELCNNKGEIVFSNSYIVETKYDVGYMALLAQVEESVEGNFNQCIDKILSDNLFISHLTNLSKDKSVAEKSVKKATVVSNDLKKGLSDLSKVLTSERNTK